MTSRDKRIVALVALMILLMTVPLNVYASGNDTIWVNGKELKGVSTANVGGVKMIPIRAVFEGLGKRVTWISATRDIVIDDGTFPLENLTRDIVEPLLTVPNYTIRVDSSVLRANTADSKYDFNYTLKNPVKLVKGTAYVSPEMLDYMGIGYAEGNKRIDIDTQLLVVGVGQENSFLEKVVSEKDLARVKKFVTDFEAKSKIKVIESEYLDTRGIESFYKYLSEIPSKDEIVNGYGWNGTVSTSIDKNSLTRIQRIKTLAPLAGIKMEFEPAVFYNIGGRVSLIGGYINYLDSDLNLEKMYNNYVKNYEETTWTVMQPKTKADIKVQLSHFLDEIKENKMVIVLVQDGQISYLE